MPDITNLNGFSIGFEPTGVDKENYQFPEVTKVAGFSIGFETTEGDRRYLDTTAIFGFSVGFEYTPLLVDSVVERRF
jgi:hypothetical protein